MVRNKPSEGIRNRRRESPRQDKGNSGPRSARKTILELIGVVGTLASVVGVLAFIPRLSVAASGSIRQQDPFGTVFILSNDSLLSIHDVVAVCSVDHFETLDDQSTDDVAFVTPESTADQLSPDQKMTLGCQRTIDSRQNARSAKVTIRVSYRPDFLWWHRDAEFPMEALRGEDGSWVWKHIAR